MSRALKIFLAAAAASAAYFVAVAAMVLVVFDWQLAVNPVDQPLVEQSGFIASTTSLALLMFAGFSHLRGIGSEGQQFVRAADAQADE